MPNNFLMPNAEAFDRVFLPQIISLAEKRLKRSSADKRIFLHGKTLQALCAETLRYNNQVTSLLDIVVAKTHGDTAIVVDRKDLRECTLVTECAEYLRERLTANGCGHWFAAATPKSAPKRVFGGTNAAFSDLGL